LARAGTTPALHSLPTRRSSDLGLSKIPHTAHRIATNDGVGVPEATMLVMLDNIGGFLFDERLIIPEKLHHQNRTGIPFYKLTVSDRKSTRLNSSHVSISYAVFC